MRILFWNLGRRALSPLVAEAARELETDILILAESVEPIATLSAALNSGQHRPYLDPPGVPSSLRRQLRILTRLPRTSVVPVADSDGISIRRVRPPIGLEFTLVAVHLRSKLHQTEIEQTIAATRIRAEIESAELRVGDRRTVLVGDLNMNPFEAGMAAADTLHAVMSRGVALRDRRTVDKQSRTFFYNAMWSHFGDRTPGPSGTFYDAGSRQLEFFWHMFDQVLIRPSLLDFFDDRSVQIVSTVGRRSLLRPDGTPNSSIGSDHLPITFAIDIERGIQENVS